MTDSSMLKYQYETILDQLLLLQLHAESPDCPCSLRGDRPGELGEFCEPKHLRSIIALARETISMEEDATRIEYLENLVLEGSELLGKMSDKLCDKEVDLGDYVTWSRDKRKPLEGFCYSGFCDIHPQEEEGAAIVEEVATMFERRRIKPTKHEMAINILRALYRAEIKVGPDGKPIGAGARKQYNKYLTLPASELEKQNETAVKIIGELISKGKFEEDAEMFQKASPRVDLSYKSWEFLKALQAKIENDPANQMPKGSGSWHKYIPAARKKLEDIAWAITNKMARERNPELSRKKAEPRWCYPVKETDKELSKLSRTLGTAKKRISEIQKDLEMPLNICRGQAEMFEGELGAKRVTYNRGDINSVIEAAKRLKSVKNLYIFATSEGFILTSKAPLFRQRHIIVSPDGSTQTVNPSLGAEMFESSTGVLDPYGSRCRDPETGTWVNSLECGYEPAGITTTALGMDGITRYEFEFKIVSLDKLIISHDPFTFAVNPDYPADLQPRLRGRAATKIQVEKIAANLEPDAVITDFHVIDRGTPIVGPDLVVEAGNGRVMGMIKAAADYPDKYANYKKSLSDRARDYGLRAKDVDSIENPVLVRVRITDVDRNTFAQEANQAATIAPSAIENARTDAQKITMGMLLELVIGENESLEDALRAPKNQAFAKRFLATLPENVQAALVDAQGYLNRDGVHRMAMAIFVSAFQGDPGLRLAEKAFESVDMDVRNTVNAIARSLGTLAQAEALTRTGERDTALSIGDDLAQTVNVYSAIKRNPALTIEKYLAQKQIFARELTPFQEKILVVLEEYKRAPRKLAGIFTAYAQGVIAAPPPAQVALIPGVEITKEGLWESAVKAPEVEPALMEVAKMFEMADGSYEWLASKIDVCNLTSQQIFSALTWRPLQNLVAWGVGQGKAVRLCQTGMVDDAFQLNIIDLDTQQVAMATKMAQAIPTAKRVYTPYREVVYEIVVPSHIGSEDLTWTPQAVEKIRGERGKQPALFMEVAKMFEESEAQGYIGRLPGELNNLRGYISGARKALEQGDQGEAFDHIVTAQTMVNLLYRGIPLALLLETCDRPSVKYQHLSTFFTETAVEAALFAAEEGVTERKIDMVLAQLQSGIEAIHESSKFKEFIDTMAKFHNYSLGNIMLITLQRPDATRVAGFRAWQELGRNVKKGESGIMILAPCFPPKPKKEKDDEEGEEEIEREQVPVFFKVVHVFDIGQTSGEELPEVEVPVITGEATGSLFQAAAAYVAKQGITLDSDPKPDLSTDLMGFWRKSENLIWVRPDAPQDQRTKTLLHETAHAMAAMRGARDAEVMAESVAYTVANHFGFDTGVRSFPYVATWARDVKVLKSNLEIIRKVSKDMIEGIEHVGELSDLVEVARLFAPMKLLTKEIRKKLPALYSQEEVEDPMVQVKFFTPDSNWTWYGIEFDGDETFFGWVVGFEKELGYFNLKELESARGPLGLSIERDLYFKPMPLSEVKKLHQDERGELVQGSRAEMSNFTFPTQILPAVLTGLGLNIGFRIVDYATKRLKKGKSKDLQPSAGGDEEGGNSGAEQITGGMTAKEASAEPALSDEEQEELEAVDQALKNAEEI